MAGGDGFRQTKQSRNACLDFPRSVWVGCRVWATWSLPVGAPTGFFDRYIIPSGVKDRLCKAVHSLFMQHECVADRDADVNADTAVQRVDPGETNSYGFWRTCTSTLV